MLSLLMSGKEPSLGKRPVTGQQVSLAGGCPPACQLLTTQVQPLPAAKRSLSAGGPHTLLAEAPGGPAQYTARRQAEPGEHGQQLPRYVCAR